MAIFGDGTAIFKARVDRLAHLQAHLTVLAFQSFGVKTPSKPVT
jgi:hypothetical protein